MQNEEKQGFFDKLKKVKEDVEKSTEESEGRTISGTLGGNAWASGIEKRTLELAKRYALAASI